MDIPTELLPTQFARLEALLRKHGFLGGVMTKEDEAATDALLADLRKTAITTLEHPVEGKNG